MKIFKATHERRKIVVIVNGYPRAGKDTFVEFAGNFFAYMGWGAYSSSTVDFVKAITEAAGIAEEPKTPEKRALWAELKTAFEKYDRFISRRTVAEMEHAMFQSARAAQIGFIFAREPDAINFMKTLVKDCEFITVFVDRHDAETVTSNAADMGVEDFSYDFVINNHSDLAELKLASERFVHEVIAMKGPRQ
ncbi:hypothetical protein ShzoTeo12_10410 [Shinella zoogloeoides]|nr:hypothetical protein ShzoTeo12_10410 [Shinella zoogloeoides]